MRYFLSVTESHKKDWHLMTDARFFLTGTRVNARGSGKVQGIFPEVYMPQIWFHQFGFVQGILGNIKRSKNPTTKRISITIEGVTVH